MKIVIEKKVNDKVETKTIFFEDLPIYLRSGWKESKMKPVSKKETKVEEPVATESDAEFDDFSFKKKKRY